MKDAKSIEEKQKVGRPPVGVMAQRARERLVQLREKEKQQQLKTRAKKEELKKLVALATARDRRLRISKERAEEKKIVFALGHLLLEKLAPPGVTQAIVGPAEVERLDADLQQALSRYVARRREQAPPSNVGPGEATISVSGD